MRGTSELLVLLAGSANGLHMGRRAPERSIHPFRAIDSHPALPTHLDKQLLRVTPHASPSATAATSERVGHVRRRALLRYAALGTLSAPPTAALAAPTASTADSPPAARVVAAGAAMSESAPPGLSRELYAESLLLRSLPVECPPLRVIEAQILNLSVLRLPADAFKSSYWCALTKGE